MNMNASAGDSLIIESSGNPYADAGLPDAEELLAKAKLVRLLAELTHSD
jgi:hypothetical protein